MNTNGETGSPSRPGLQLLLQAYEYAHDLGRDVWDFAVEFRTLQNAGLSSSDIRWLGYKGYVDHARETTASGDSGRTFRRQNQLALRKRSCFAVTDTGANFIRESVSQLEIADDESTQPSSSSVVGTSDEGITPGVLDELTVDASGSPLTPTWDCDRQELRVGRLVVKEFKLHAPNQVMILAAFEEKMWPSRMDDPLRPQPQIDAKTRLDDTIKKLNRKQKRRLVRFQDDGSGHGIHWEFQAASEQ